MPFDVLPADQDDDGRSDPKHDRELRDRSLGLSIELRERLYPLDCIVVGV